MPCYDERLLMFVLIVKVWRILDLQETNLSVMMPGDSIPSFLANAKPHGSTTDAELSDLLVSEARDTSQALR